MIMRQDILNNSDIMRRREKLLDLLVFARDEIQGQLDLENCPHGGWFAIEDERCHVCSANQECAWLLHNDGVLPWTERSDGDLLRALHFAVQLLDIHARDREHNVQICACDACTWLRSARYYLADHHRRAHP